MKKSIMVLSFTLVFALLSATTVFSTEYDSSLPRIIDNSGVLTESEEDKLNSLAFSAIDEAGIDILVLLTDDQTTDTMTDYAVNYYNDNGYGCGETKDGTVLILDTVQWSYSVEALGEAGELLTPEACDDCFSAGSDALNLDDYFTGIRQYIEAVKVSATVNSGFDLLDSYNDGATLFESGTAYNAELDRVADYADLLSDTEEAELEAKAAEILNDMQFDVVILTVEDFTTFTDNDYSEYNHSVTEFSPEYLGQNAIEQFAADYYDYGGYGYGPDKDGIVFVISMADRDYSYITSGAGLEFFTDYGLEYLDTERVLPMLKDGNYFGAFKEYQELSVEFINKARLPKDDGGGAFDIDNQYKINPFVAAYNNLAIIIVIAAIIAAVVLWIMKSKMNTVVKRSAAADYALSNSFVLSAQNDRFLFRTTTRRKIQTQSSSSGGRSSGGSSSFRGSSGSSHGGRSGKF